MKYSRQRELILETIRQSPIHPTAEEIYSRAKEKMPSLSLGTVYRNLALLSELGMIGKLEASGNHSVHYDGRNDEHCHLVCTKCGSINDIELDTLPTIDSAVARKTGFIVTEHEIVLKGTCAACAAHAKSES